MVIRRGSMLSFDAIPSLHSHGGTGFPVSLRIIHHLNSKTDQRPTNNRRMRSPHRSPSHSPSCAHRNIAPQLYDVDVEFFSPALLTLHIDFSPPLFHSHPHSSHHSIWNRSHSRELTRWISRLASPHMMTFMYISSRLQFDYNDLADRFNGEIVNR
jgi:hypothetical protein